LCDTDPRPFIAGLAKEGRRVHIEAFFDYLIIGNKHNMCMFFIFEIQDMLDKEGPFCKVGVRGEEIGKIFDN